MGAGALKGKKEDGAEDPEAKQAGDWLQKNLEEASDEKVKDALDGVSEEGRAKIARALVTPKEPEKAKSFRMLAVCGGIRKASCNKGLLRVAEEWAKENGVEFVWADTKSLPLFDADDGPMDDPSKPEVRDGKPDAVKAFYAELEKADAILFGCPEHNYSISTALKNAIDWGSRGKNPDGTQLWKGKVAGIVGAGGPQGTCRSQLALRQSGVFLDIRFVNAPEVCLQAFAPGAFDMATGDPLSDEYKNKVRDMASRTRAMALEIQAGASLPKGALRRGSFLPGSEEKKAA